jgi:hypothetical protein
MRRLALGLLVATGCADRSAELEVDYTLEVARMCEAYCTRGLECIAEPLIETQEECVEVCTGLDIYYELPRLLRVHGRDADPARSGMRPRKSCAQTRSRACSNSRAVLGRRKADEPEREGCRSHVRAGRRHGLLDAADPQDALYVAL